MSVAIPKAVASTVKTPGHYLTVNLLGGSANPASSNLRVLMICPKTSAGNITVNTEVRQCFGADDVATALGEGNIGHLASKLLFAHDAIASLDVVAPTASAGVVASATFTFTGPATGNSIVRFRIHGRIIDVQWFNGESVATFQARAVLAINALASDLFVTASGSSPDIVLTAKVAGLWGNDVVVSATVIDGGSGIAVSVSPTALSSGTLEPDISTALSNVDTFEYAAILLIASNTDAASSSSTSNPGRLKTHIGNLNTGNAAKLQVGFVGHTGSIANVKTGAAARNSEVMSYVFGQSFEDLPGELAGAEVGDAIRFARFRANYNRIGNKLRLRGPKDPAASKLTASELEDLLSNGVTALDQELGTNEVFVARPITTHSLNGSNPDYRCLDMSDVWGTYAVARDLRSAVPIEFPNASVSEDLPANSDPLPEGVVEVKDIRAFVLSRLEFWAKQGVIDRTRLRAAIANGDMTFEIDAVDTTQVNTVLPFSIVKPLAKVGTVIRKVA